MVSKLRMIWKQTVERVEAEVAETPVDSAVQEAAAAKFFCGCAPAEARTRRILQGLVAKLHGLGSGQEVLGQLFAETQSAMATGRHAPLALAESYALNHTSDTPTNLAGTNAKGVSSSGTVGKTTVVSGTKQNPKPLGTSRVNLGLGFGFGARQVRS